MVTGGWQGVITLYISSIILSDLITDNGSINRLYSKTDQQYHGHHIKKFHVNFLQ